MAPGTRTNLHCALIAAFKYTKRAAETKKPATEVAGFFRNTSSNQIQHQTVCGSVLFRVLLFSMVKP